MWPAWAGLEAGVVWRGAGLGAGRLWLGADLGAGLGRLGGRPALVGCRPRGRPRPGWRPACLSSQIGRASCRERVYVLV